MPDPSMHPVEFEFGDPQRVSCLPSRSSRHERLYSGQRFRVLSPHEVQELSKKCSIVILFLASLLRRKQMRRILMAKFINGAEVFVCFFSPEGEVSGATQGILYALGIHRFELIREALRWDEALRQIPV